MRKGIVKKGIGVGVACSLVLLIFAVLVPSAAAVRLSLGSPCDSSVFAGDTIIFNCVQLTIRGDEWDPVNDLEFVIYQCPDEQRVDYVRFSLCGVEICDPACRFSIVAVTDISTDFHHNGMCSHCNDMEPGCHDRHDFDYGYGYGYGYGYDCQPRCDLTITYHITYRTQCPGTYYAKLLAHSNCNTYSSESILFTVSTQPSCPPPVSPPPSCTPPVSEPPSCTPSNHDDNIPDFRPNCMNTHSHERSSVFTWGTDSSHVHQLHRQFFCCWLMYVFLHMQPCCEDNFHQLISSFRH